MITELAIESIGIRGDGLAHHEGRRVHVPFSLPGERIRARVEGDRGEMTGIVEASTERVAPSCKYFGVCGGCALQHWNPQSVARWKRTRLIAALQRERIEAEVAETIDAHGAGRRRVMLHVRNREGRIMAGFMRARSHDLVDLESCPLLAPALASAPEIARGIGNILCGTTKPLDVLITASNPGLDCDMRGAGNVPEGLRQKFVAFAIERNLARLTSHGERLIEACVPTISLEGHSDLLAYLPAGSFLQATARAEQLLADLATEGIGRARHVADLFCGFGPFALRLARAMKVSAHDSDRASIDALTRSLCANPGGKPAAAEARDLFRRPLLAQEMKTFDAVLLDPPRQGAEAQVREITKSKLARLVYVSCDPESFARDARILADGGFSLTKVTPVDQFRHSPHVELVALFTR